MRLTNDQRDLCAEHVPLARVWAAHFISRHPWAERVIDCESTALESLCSAATTYDPTLGEFPPFAQRVVRNAMIDACRHAMRPKRHLPDTLQLTRSHLRQLLDPSPGPQEQVETAEFLDKAMENMDPSHQHALYMRHGLGMTLIEVARELDVCIETARTYANAALAKIQSEVDRS